MGGAAKMGDLSPDWKGHPEDEENLDWQDELEEDESVRGDDDALEGELDPEEEEIDWVISQEEADNDWD